MEDKNSRNGTYIMNQRIQPGKPVKIRRGDAIRFADVELQWSQIPLPEDNSAYKALFSIGTHFNNDMQIAGATVSRYHATIKLGRDNKMYIVDHSKNGTTVNGVKISSHQPYRIKKSSAVVCGGVPVDTSRLPWPSEWWKTALAIAATLLVVVGLGFGVWKWVVNRDRSYDDGELYAMYNNSVVYLEGIYHYHISGVPENVLQKYLCVIQHPADVLSGRSGENRRNVLVTLAQCQDFIFINDGIIPTSILKSWEISQPSYSGTGFFISNDGKIVTNLHVVKPWLFESQQDQALELFKKFFALQIDEDKEDAAYLSQMKVEGVLDGILYVPQGKYYSVENAVSCRVLSAGNEIEKDVALVQSEKGELPQGARFINVNDSIDDTDDAYKVGEHIYTIGFPAGMKLQDQKNEKGIQVFAQGGDITRQDGEYEFSYNAATTGGASGSPVFNRHGMLVGIHHAGASQSLTQGYNFGVKAKYIKEIIDSPHKVQ